MFLKSTQVSPDEFEYAVRVSMTPRRFIQYHEQSIQECADEPLYEMIAEFKSEQAMFGDGGPGSALRIQQCIASYNQAARVYAKLTGTTYRPFQS